MTSRTPRRHRRLALMAAGTAAAMVLLPGAASAQAVYTVQQFAGAPSDPAVPSVPGDDPAAPKAPDAPTAPAVPVLPKELPVPKDVPLLPGKPEPAPTGAEERRDDTPDSDHLHLPEPPDHASGAVASVDLLKSRLLDITKYDATIEDDDKAHADSTVLGLGGSQIIGSSASSDGKNKEDENSGGLIDLCDATDGGLCLSLLYHSTFATKDHDSVVAAARGGVLALCLGGKNKDTVASYDCDGLGLGLAEGKGYIERDKKHGHTTAESANELLNLCLGKREKLTEPCDGIGLQAVHSESDSKSEKPDTNRGSYLLGIDLNGQSTYLLDEPTAVKLLDGCGDSALLCLFLNQGKSVIFKNPKGAGSVQEMLRLDLLNKTLLVVLGQAETLVHETEGRDRGKDHGRPDEHDKGDEGHKGEGHGEGGKLAYTGAGAVAPLLAGGFLLTGLGALTLAATRRRIGKHSA